MQAACRQQQHAGTHCQYKQPSFTHSTVLARPALPVRHKLRCYAQQQQKESQKTDKRSSLAPSSLNGKQGTITPQQEEQVRILALRPPCMLCLLGLTWRMHMCMLSGIKQACSSMCAPPGFCGIDHQAADVQRADSSSWAARRQQLMGAKELFYLSLLAPVDGPKFAHACTSCMYMRTLQPGVLYIDLTPPHRPGHAHY